MKNIKIRKMLLVILSIIAIVSTITPVRVFAAKNIDTKEDVNQDTSEVTIQETKDDVSLDTSEDINQATLDTMNKAVVANNIESNTTGIIIDGYFDDWLDKPMSSLYWNNNNGNAYDTVSLIKDDDYIYIYVKFHYSINSSRISDMSILINGTKCPIYIKDSNGDMNFKNNKRYTGLYLYANNSIAGSAAASTEKKYGQNDELEVGIDIKALESAMGLPAGTVNSGSVINFDMGGSSVELVGTSTGAVLGVLLCIGTIIGVKWYRTKKARLAQ